MSTPIGLILFIVVGALLIEDLSKLLLRLYTPVTGCSFAYRTVRLDVGCLFATSPQRSERWSLWRFQLESLEPEK